MTVHEKEGVAGLRRASLALLVASAPWVWSGGSETPGAAGIPELRLPRLDPDYVGVVVPPNMAPLNFVIEEPGEGYRTRVSGPFGKAIEVAGSSPAVVLPLGAWSALLQTNRGHSLSIEIGVCDAGGRWRAFEAVTNHVAEEEIDRYLVYRRLRPLYNFYRTLGIYERDLETFEERPVLENTGFGRGCLNCHTFLGNQPDPMALNIRSPQSGHPLLVVRSNQVAHVAKTAGYLAWHPGGRLLTFSANKLSLFFHTTGETRDVFDADSDLGIYRVDANAVVSPEPLARPDRLETWPAWAPDGRTLYYSSAPKLGNMDRRRFRQIRYDLVCVAYDPDQDRWGEPETVVSAEAVGRSAVQPRVSPDGRFLVYGLCAYGHFPVYRPDADLYILDLEGGEPRRLEINSDAADSWHCWSSNSRWLVFSSKRRDGLFARPYFSHMDSAGRFSKPILLPQRDPRYFDQCLDTLNVPELIRHPITVPASVFVRAVVRPERRLEPAVGPSSQASTAPVQEYEDAHAGGEPGRAEHGDP